MTVPNSPLFNSNSLMALASRDQAAMDAFSEAVYLRAGDGRVLCFNQRAAPCCLTIDTLWAVALQTAGSFRDQEVVIEEPGGRRPVGCRCILLREGIC